MTLISKNITKKPQEKYHLIANIDRTVPHTNKNWVLYHSRLLKVCAKSTDSRVLEAKTLKVAQKLINGILFQEHDYEE